MCGVGFPRCTLGPILLAYDACRVDEGGFRMTEPTGGTPPLPPQEPSASALPPVAAPAPAAPAPAAPAASSWQVPPPSAGATAAGPAPGIAYAGLGIRIVALIIDYILLLIVFSFVAIALGAIFLTSLINGGSFM